MYKEAAPHELEIQEDDPFNLEESLNENVAHFIWHGVDSIKLAANCKKQYGADTNAWGQDVALPLMDLALLPYESLPLGRALLKAISVYVSKPYYFLYVIAAIH